ncbi:MAG: hypothetical protein JJU10_07725 [Idiomarina sp.]|nr:hypothetical protein [Idiomarina sp.]
MVARASKLLTLIGALVFLSACGSESTSTKITVETSVKWGGAISPASQTVPFDESATFTLTPNEGYSIASVTGCDGTLDGLTFTTAALKDACSLKVVFRSPYTLTFHVTDADSFILYIREMMEVIPSDGHHRDTPPIYPAQATNFMKRNLAGEVRPVVESYFTHHVKSFSITPDERFMYVFFGPQYISFRQNDHNLIAAMDCSIFRVDLADGSHECAAPGRLYRSDYQDHIRNEFTDMVSTTSMSPDMTGDTWDGSLMLRTESFKVESCTSPSTPCLWQRSGVVFADSITGLTRTPIQNLTEIDKLLIEPKALSQDRMALRYYDDLYAAYAFDVQGPEGLISRHFRDSSSKFYRADNFAHASESNGDLWLTERQADNEKRASINVPSSRTITALRDHAGRVFHLGSGELYEVLPATGRTTKITASGSPELRQFIVSNEEFSYLAYSWLESSQIDLHNMQTGERERRLSGFEGRAWRLFGWEYSNGIISVAYYEGAQRDESFFKTIDVLRLLEGAAYEDVITVSPVPQTRETTNNTVRRIHSFVRSEQATPDFTVAVEAEGTEGRSVSVIFSVPVDRDSVDAAVSLIDYATGLEVDYVRFWVRNTLHLIPNTVDINEYVEGPLQSGHEYQLRFHGEIRARDGRVLPEAQKAPVQIQVP